jgi:hypothetical protein
MADGYDDGLTSGFSGLMGNPQQQEYMRRQMMAQALMGASQGPPATSLMGGLSQGLNRGLAYGMMSGGGQQPPTHYAPQAQPGQVFPGGFTAGYAPAAQPGQAFPGGFNVPGGAPPPVYNMPPPPTSRTMRTFRMPQNAPMGFGMPAQPGQGMPQNAPIGFGLPTPGSIGSGGYYSGAGY